MKSKRPTSSSPLRRLRVLLLSILTLFTMLPAKAGLVDPTNPMHFNVLWEQAEGRFKFTVRLIDFEGSDMRLRHGDIFADGKHIFHLDCEDDPNASNSVHTCKVYNNIGGSNAGTGIIVAEAYNEKISAMYLEVVPSVTEKTFAFKKDGNTVVGVFYWYPSTETDMNSQITFTINMNERGTAWSKDRSASQKATSKAFVYTPSITSSDFTDKGELKVQGQVNYGNGSTTTKTLSELQTSVNGRDFYSHAAAVTSTGTTTLPDFVGTAYMDYVSGSSGTHLTARQFADGVYFRIKTVTTPSSFSTYQQTNYSEQRRTTPMAVFEDRTLRVEQTGRNIKLSWKVYVPSNCSGTRFVIQRQVSGMWTNVGELARSGTETNYSYSYILDDAECNRGNVSYRFRVWAEPTSTRWDDALWTQYLLSNEAAIDVNTNYLTLSKPAYATIDGVHTLTWSFNETSGIWDNAVDVQVLLKDDTDNTPVEYLDVDRTSTSYVFRSLAGCHEYTARLYTRVSGVAYQTTDPITFQTADTGRRTISSVKASKGYYSNYVDVAWEVPLDESDFEYYVLTRTRVGSDKTIELQQFSNTGLQRYVYQDRAAEPGVYYTYAVTGYNRCNGRPAIGASRSDVGYTQPYATISGRIAYDSSQGVGGVAVNVTPIDDGLATNAFANSLYFEGNDASSVLTLPAQTANFGSGAFTFQGWFNPDEPLDNYRQIMIKPGVFEVKTKYRQGNKLIFYLKLAEKQCDFESILPYHTWTHVTFTIQLNDARTEAEVVYYVNGKKFNTYSLTGLTASSFTSAAANAFTIGGGASGYTGHLDEVRLWNICLDEATIADTWNRYITGRERGLTGYYRCDESGLQQVFDLSGSGDSFNANDGALGIAVRHSSNVPEAENLSNKAYTDADGNFLINTIPYTADGVQYSVVPTLGIHEFSPTKQTIFASAHSTVLSSINFADVSSFPVSGVVYYAGTTYPVEGVNLYVDGQLASRYGRPVTTDGQGEYTIDVPIGDHYVSVGMPNHSFVDDGRYPADPNGIRTRYTFTGPVSDLTFYDSTTQILAGRVSGGTVQNSLPLGLGESKANIGQAVITLDAGRKLNVELETNEGSFSYVNASRLREYAAASPYVASTAVTGTGDDDVHTIVITTDPVTGEFAAKVPPVPFTVRSIVVPGNPDVRFDPTTLAAPRLQAEAMTTDSLQRADGTTESFSYHSVLKANHRSAPQLEVTDISFGRTGAFGQPTVKAKDSKGDLHEVTAYTLAPDGTPDYAFGFPVYVEMDKYTYDLYGYEAYENYDACVRADDEPVVDKVPLAGVTVTARNAFSSAASIRLDNYEIHAIEDDEFELNDEGHARYIFTAGFPNIAQPYTRTAEFIYNVDGTAINWVPEGQTDPGLEAIVLGVMPTGDNFVTKGPDRIDMVLRDPPGTLSQTTLTKGTEITSETSYGRTVSSENTLEFVTNFGTEQSNASGVGLLYITQVDVKDELTTAGKATEEYTSSDAVKTTITTGEEISTSDGSDFVGAPGDVFIGHSTNMNFGMAHDLRVTYSADGQHELEVKEVISIGEKYDTQFHYTQNYVENALIPNLYALRDATLLPKGTTVIAADVAAGPVFVSNVEADDPNFGLSNDDEAWGESAGTASSTANNLCTTVGPSYTMYSNPVESAADLVMQYNEAIAQWERVLYDNEKAKVTAMNYRGTYLERNVSFDAGASYKGERTTSTGYTSSYENTAKGGVVIGNKYGFKVNGGGLTWELSTETLAGDVRSGSDEETTSQTISYTLAEEGDDDALSVDIFKAPDGFGPIFVTRAGQTCCPWEDRVVTNYYAPGTEISARTMQIEVPAIDAYPKVATGVPSGEAAQFTLTLNNLSETGEDVYFGIGTCITQGATVYMDGLELGPDNIAFVPAGEEGVKRTVQVYQTDESVLDYENIAIRLFSQCQADNTGVFHEVADTVFISVHFQPACSGIELATSTTLINRTSGTTLRLSASGYDINHRSLRGVKLQYRGVSDTEWNTLSEYVVDSALATGLLLPLPAGSFDFDLDMANINIFPDQTYYFRAVTVCNFGGVEVEGESDVITVVKDVARPQLIAAPSPASGILTPEGEISISFNEDIRASVLNKPDNFSITARLNGAEVAHNTALAVPAAATSASAKTEAAIDLSDTSFSVNLWMKYTAAGTIVQHGTGASAFRLAVDATDHLVATVGGETYTSNNTLTRDKWMFLSVAYDAEGPAPTLTAHCASDASQAELFAGIPVTQSSAGSNLGRSALALGEGLGGAIHEVSLWNYPRTWIEAQSEMYQTKSNTTRGLMGYWPLDEGHGTTAEDHARSRHLVLSGESGWSIAAANHALALDGQTPVSVDVTTIGTEPDESYLVETWFLAEPQQKTAAAVLSMSQGAAELLLDAKGALSFVLNGQEYALGTKNYRDGLWHHAAINVLKSVSGTCIVYIDGQALRQFTASAMPRLTGSELLLGARHDKTACLKGAVDEVRIWKGVRTAAVIDRNMWNRIDPHSPGLVAYYPFEKIVIDGANQSYLDFTTEEQSAGRVSLTSALSTMNAAESAPSLAPVPMLQNVKFDFVANERKILINLGEEPAALENCNVNVTVRDVRDSHGNLTDGNITWNVFVQQNRLKWAAHEVELRKEQTETVTFKAEIQNNGSTLENWTLSGLPAWLTASEESGSIAPLSSRTLTFTVNPALAIGHYETTCYLTGSLGIADPLVIDVVSVGETPDWTVDTSGYEYTMNIVGQIVKDGVPSTNTEDIVAAFSGEDCVGVAHPVYIKRYDTYYVMMDVYGNETDNGAPLNFKVYDAATGTAYPLVTTKMGAREVSLKWNSEDVQGTLAAPLFFIPEEAIEQSLALKKGWTWTSLYVTPKDATPSSLFPVTASLSPLASYLKTKTLFTEWTSAGWKGSLKQMKVGEMYKVNAPVAATASIVGRPANPADVVMTIAPGWNWIGYNCSGYNTLESAFADLAPENGDMVKSQSTFSIYDEGEWVGNLNLLTPGLGYCYRSEAAQTKTFHYPANAASTGRKVLRKAEADGAYASPGYEGNMAVVAVVKCGDAIVDGATVGVFADGELRGYSEQPIAAPNDSPEWKDGGKSGVHFITVAGDKQTDVLRFVVEVDGAQYVLSATLRYEDDGVCGSLAAPYELQIGLPTGVEILGTDADGEIYDLSGRRVVTRSIDNSAKDFGQPAGSADKGVYIQSGTKVIK